VGATAAHLAKLVCGDVVGDPARTVHDVAPLHTAGPTTCTFLAHKRHVQALPQSQAGIVLVGRATFAALPDTARATQSTLIVCADATWAMAHVASALWQAPTLAQGISPHACIDPTAKIHPLAHIGPGAIVAAHAQIGADAQIGAQAFVGEHACVGARSVMHPGARLLWGCELGAHCILHTGCVVGSDGFGFAKNPHGPDHVKVPQMGTVWVGDHVDIGANTTIDRATFGATRIGAGCKIDNLVQIGHNVVLGEHCIVVSQSGIAGSTTVGDHVVIGAQAGVVGHVHIASGTILAARAGVISTIEQPGVYAGLPAMAHKAWLRMLAAQRALPAFKLRLMAMERKLAAIKDPR
jgi:UDP-3-O-[3-hydroxymyristoyl] glucosamine N-acyltransferase